MGDQRGLPDAALEVLHRDHRRRIVGRPVRQRAEDLAHPVHVGQRIAEPPVGFRVLVGLGQAPVGFRVADQLLGPADHLGGGADVELDVERLLRAGRIDPFAQPRDDACGAGRQRVEFGKGDGRQHVAVHGETPARLFCAYIARGCPASQVRFSDEATGKTGVRLPAHRGTESGDILRRLRKSSAEPGSRHPKSKISSLRQSPQTGTYPQANSPAGISGFLVFFLFETYQVHDILRKFWQNLTFRVIRLTNRECWAYLSGRLALPVGWCLGLTFRVAAKHAKSLDFRPCFQWPAN